MSSFPTNLAYRAKIGTKLEDAKSVKNSMTDQQQNSDDITDSFNVLNLLVLFSKASFNEVSSSDSKAAELPAFYQCLDCSRVNVQM